MESDTRNMIVTRQKIETFHSIVTGKEIEPYYKIVTSKLERIKTADGNIINE